MTTAELQALVGQLGTDRLSDFEQLRQLAGLHSLPGVCVVSTWRIQGCIHGVYDNVPKP
jgi:hypothetical protein